MAKNAITDQMVQKRRDLVETLYRSGVGRATIVRMGAQELGSSANVTLRNIDSDIVLIRKKWKEQAVEIFSEDVSSWWISVALADRRAAQAAGDHRLAYQIAKDIAKMAGVNLSDLTIHHTGDKAETLTWLELMNRERENKHLVPADFEVVGD